MQNVLFWGTLLKSFWMKVSFSSSVFFAAKNFFAAKCPIFDRLLFSSLDFCLGIWKYFWLLTFFHLFSFVWKVLFLRLRPRERAGGGRRRTNWKESRFIEKLLLFSLSSVLWPHKCQQKRTFCDQVPGAFLRFILMTCLLCSLLKSKSYSPNNTVKTCTLPQGKPHFLRIYSKWLKLVINRRWLRLR